MSPEARDRKCRVAEPSGLPSNVARPDTSTVAASRNTSVLLVTLQRCACRPRVRPQPDRLLRPSSGQRGDRQSAIGNCLDDQIGPALKRPGPSIRASRSIAESRHLSAGRLARNSPTLAGDSVRTSSAPRRCESPALRRAHHLRIPVAPGRSQPERRWRWRCRPPVSPSRHCGHQPSRPDSPLSVADSNTCTTSPPCIGGGQCPSLADGPCRGDTHWRRTVPSKPQ